MTEATTCPTCGAGEPLWHVAEGYCSNGHLPTHNPNHDIIHLDIPVTRSQWRQWEHRAKEQGVDLETFIRCCVETAQPGVGRARVEVYKPGDET